MLVLEAWLVTFDESLVENARFGSLDSPFWWKMLVLEAWILTFGESLMENARFGSLENHFW